MPFANPNDFVKTIGKDEFLPPEREESFDIEWFFNYKQELDYVLIRLNDISFAKISDGDKPGYCFLAKKMDHWQKYCN